MSTTKEYKDYVLEQLDVLDDVICRPMMGEYLLYYKNTLFGGIYDNRILVKIVDTNKEYNMEEVIPYKNAKKMYLVSTDNKDKLKNIVINTCKSLKSKDKK